MSQMSISKEKELDQMRERLERETRRGRSRSSKRSVSSGGRSLSADNEGARSKSRDIRGREDTRGANIIKVTPRKSASLSAVSRSVSPVGRVGEAATERSELLPDEVMSNAGGCVEKGAMSAGRRSRSPIRKSGGERPATTESESEEVDRRLEAFVTVCKSATGVAQREAEVVFESLGLSAGGTKEEEMTDVTDCESERPVKSKGVRKGVESAIEKMKHLGDKWRDKGDLRNENGSDRTDKEDMMDREQGVKAKWGMPRALNHGQAEYYTSEILSEVDEGDEEELEMSNAIENLTIEELIQADKDKTIEIFKLLDENDALEARLASVMEDHDKKVKHMERKHTAEKEAFELEVLDRDRELEKLESKIQELKNENDEAKTTKAMLDRKYSENISIGEAAKRHKEESDKKTSNIEKLTQQLSLARAELAEYEERCNEYSRQFERWEELKNSMGKSRLKVGKRINMKRMASSMSLNRGGEILILENGSDDQDQRGDAGRRRNRGEDDTGRRSQTRNRDTDDEDDESGLEGAGLATNSEGRRMIKEFCWPQLEDYSTEESWRAVMKLQIRKADRMGIPGHIIANAVSQALVRCRKSADVYSEMAATYDTDTLEGVLSLIENLDFEQRPLDKGEQFEEIYMRTDETARSYLGRLRRAHKSLFPRQRESKERIRKVFLENFRMNGKMLTEKEKDYLLCTPELEDLATRATDKMKKREREGNSGERRRDREINMMDAPGDQGAEGQQMAQQMAPRQQMQQATQMMAPQTVMTPQYMPQQMAPQQYYDNQQMQQYQPRFRSQRGGYRRGAPRGAGQGMSAQEGVAPRVTAGPNAVRVAINEYERGTTANGELVCFRCCTSGHIATRCGFKAFCAYCQEEGTHPSNQHLKYLRGKQAQNPESM